MEFIDFNLVMNVKSINS